MLLPLMVFAESVEIDGIWYNLDENAKEGEVTQSPNHNYSGSLEIPESVINEGVTYSVTSISKQAFYLCTGLTSVFIPKSVTSIGNEPFQYCYGLSTILVEKSNPRFDSRNKCNAIIETSTNTVIAGCVNTIIPNSITTIGTSAFIGCRMKSFIIPNSVVSIGDYAFYGCSDLISMSIPNSVKTIGNNAFSWCSSLTSVFIPNSITFIGSQAFQGCSSLTSLTLPNNKIIIGRQAFYYCSSLTSVTIPNCETKTSSCVFGKCESLTDVYCKAEIIAKDSSDDGLFIHAWTFDDNEGGNVLYQVTLHVPETSIGTYRDEYPWKKFKNIVALNSDDIPETPKCSTPKINTVGDKIVFECETDDVEFVSELIVNDAKRYYEKNISTPQTFKITVYATKPGYDNSEIATAEFYFSNVISKSGDINGDGKVDVADHVKLSEIIMNQ